MKTVTIRKDGETIAQVWNANTYFTRLRGLLGRSLAEGGGLLLTPCGDIHTFGMRYAIDAVYLDGDMRVVGTETLAPWRVGNIFRGARHVLELPAGAAAGLSAGDTLHTEI